MMNLTNADYNVAYLANEIISAGSFGMEDPRVVDMILATPDRDLREVAFIVSQVGVEDESRLQVEGEACLNATFENYKENVKPSGFTWQSSFACLHLNEVKVDGSMLAAALHCLIGSRNREEMKDAASDLLYTGYCFLYERTGIDLKMRGAGKTLTAMIEHLVENPLVRYNNATTRPLWTVNH